MCVCKIDSQFMRWIGSMSFDEFDAHPQLLLGRWTVFSKDSLRQVVAWTFLSTNFFQTLSDDETILLTNYSMEIDARRSVWKRELNGENSKRNQSKPGSYKSTWKSDQNDWKTFERNLKLFRWKTGCVMLARSTNYFVWLIFGCL